MRLSLFGEIPRNIHPNDKWGWRKRRDEKKQCRLTTNSFVVFQLQPYNERNCLRITKILPLLRRMYISFFPLVYINMSSLLSALFLLAEAV